MHPEPSINRLLLCLLVMVISACSGLSGEPEIARTLPPRSTSIPETFDQLANLQTGASIYADNCVRCHGSGGAGDGELVASGQVSSVPDFTDQASIDEISLQAWFDVITNGRLEALMPPWQDALSVQDRWAVALYTYTLSYDEAAIAQGQSVYETNCASCHGQDGAGTADGPRLVGLLDYSEASLRARLAGHEAEVEMATAFSEADHSALVQYLRLLSSTTRRLPAGNEAAVEAPGAASAVATEEAGETAPEATQDMPQATGTIRGQIVQGTAGGPAVTGLDAVLHVVDNQFQEQVAEFTVGEDGRYVYEDVVIRPDYAYLITVNRDNVRFTSEIRIGDPGVTDMIMDVTVYEPTDDPSVLALTSRAVQMNLTAQGLYVIEVIDMVNNSDHMYVQDRIEDGYGLVSVSIPLPEGAAVQQEHTDPNRFIVSDDGREVLDTRPVLPGTAHYVQFAYALPFNDSIPISMPIDYTVAGPIAFFVEGSHLDLAGEGIEFVRNEDFNGDTYLVYQVAQVPAVGDTLRYQVRITTAEAASSAGAAASRDTLAAILVLAGAVFVAAALFLRWRQGRSVPDSSLDERRAEEIMIQIAHLDNQFDAGELDQASYEVQRNALKGTLMQKMKQVDRTRN